MAIEGPKKELFDEEAYIEGGLVGCRNSKVLEIAKLVHNDIYQSRPSLGVFPNELRGSVIPLAMDENPDAQIRNVATLLSKIVGRIQDFLADWHGLTHQEVIDGLVNHLESVHEYSGSIVSLGNGYFMLRAIDQDGNLLGSLVINLHSGLKFIERSYYFKAGNYYIRISQQAGADNQREVLFLEEHPNIHETDDLKVGPHVELITCEDGKLLGPAIWKFAEFFNYTAKNAIWFEETSPNSFIVHRNIVVTTNVDTPVICREFAMSQSINGHQLGKPGTIMRTMARYQHDPSGPMSLVRRWTDIDINLPTDRIMEQATYEPGKVMYENTWEILKDGSRTSGYISKLVGKEALPRYLPVLLEIRVENGVARVFGDGEEFEVSDQNLEMWMNHLVEFKVGTGKTVRVVLEAGIVKEILRLPDPVY